MIEAIPESVRFELPGMPAPVLMSILAWSTVAVFSIAARAGMKKKAVPSGCQNVFECCVEPVMKIAGETIGEAAPRYYPLFFAIFFYILVSNVMGLIPGLVSPTSDLNTTVGLALIVFIYYNAEGFRRKGLGYLKHFFGPELPWYFFPVRLLMFCIEMIGNFAKPFSLALRLFCNIFSKEILLGLLALLTLNFLKGPDSTGRFLTIAPLLLRPFILLLGLLIAYIQALIFLVLSISYIAGAVRTEH
jgi:F-type H+-transporting ATPase subunit a